LQHQHQDHVVAPSKTGNIATAGSKRVDATEKNSESSIGNGKNRIGGRLRANRSRTNGELTDTSDEDAGSTGEEKMDAKLFPSSTAPNKIHSASSSNDHKHSSVSNNRSSEDVKLSLYDIASMQVAPSYPQLTQHSYLSIDGVGQDGSPASSISSPVVSQHSRHTTHRDSIDIAAERKSSRPSGLNGATSSNTFLVQDSKQNVPGKYVVADMPPFPATKLAEAKPSSGAARGNSRRFEDDDIYITEGSASITIEDEDEKISRSLLRAQRLAEEAVDRTSRSYEQQQAEYQRLAQNSARQAWSQPATSRPNTSAAAAAVAAAEAMSNFRSTGGKSASGSSGAVRAGQRFGATTTSSAAPQAPNQKPSWVGPNENSSNPGTNRTPKVYR
jgi:hypothetical protein